MCCNCNFPPATIKTCDLYNFDFFVGHSVLQVTTIKNCMIIHSYITKSSKSYNLLQFSPSVSCIILKSPQSSLSHVYLVMILSQLRYINIIRGLNYVSPSPPCPISFDSQLEIGCVLKRNGHATHAAASCLRHQCHALYPAHILIMNQDTVYLLTNQVIK